MPPIFSQVKFTTPGFSVINRSKLRAIERQIPDLELVDDARCVGGGDAHQWSVFVHGDLLAGFADLQGKVDDGALIHHQLNARANCFLESGLLA